MQVYHSISISHKEASINELSALIETLPTDKNSYLKHLNEVKIALDLEELFVLTTCNRILAIFVLKSKIISQDFIDHLIATLIPTSNSLSDLKNKFTYRNHNNTIQHTFELAAGLDSMVLGEHEILGQLKKTYFENKLNKLSGDHIRLLIEYTITSAKSIFSNTDLGKNSVSIVALAINILKEKSFNPNAKIILVGAGEIITTVTKFLTKLNFKNVDIYNRTLEKARNLASSFGGKAYTLNELGNDGKLDFDILISCINHTHTIINRAQVNESINKKRLIIDLAVPSNVNTDVELIPELDLVNMQYLQNQSKLNLAKRGLSLTAANKLLNQYITEFNLVFEERQLEKALGEIPKKIKQVKRQALDTVFEKQISSLDKEAQDTLFEVLNYFEKKSIGIPMIEAKKALKNNKLRI